MAYLNDEEEEYLTQNGEVLLSPQSANGSVASLAPIVLNASVGGDDSGDGKNDLNITAPGSSGEINGAIFTDAVNVGSGTGNYNTFLAIQDNNDPGKWEAGFNTIDTPPLDNSNPEIDHAKTEPVLLGAVPVTEVDGVLYYEFRVDLNEANSGVNSQISLDQFQIYVSTDGGIIELSVLQSQMKVYDMDDGPDGDVSVLLSEEFSSGSGTDDYAVLVPASLFAGFNPTTYYMYLYVEMGRAGDDWGVNGGFEEWNLANAVILQGNKFEDINGNGIQDDGEGGIEGVLVYIDENKDGQFNYTDVDLSGDFNEGDVALERWTLTDSDGNYYFGSVALGESDFTLWIAEVVPEGYVRTTGPYEEVFVDSDADPGTILIVDPIGNRPLTPSITITKDVDYLVDGADTGTVGNDGAGDQIVYTISVNNNGELALTNVVVTDPNADGGSITYISGDTGDDGIMDVGETWIYSAVHTITQAEIDGKGSDATGAIDGDNDVDNVATVNADSANGSVTDNDPAEQVIQYLPDFSVLKEVTSITDDGDFGASGQADSAGDVINYLITVTNTGHVTLTNFMYTDANADGDTITVSTNGNGDANLDVGETWTFTATHTVTQDELDSPGSDDTGALDTDGDVDNKVVVDFDEVGPKDSSVETDLVYAPDFTVQKAVTSITDDDDFGASGQADSAGDVIHYSITIINTGNITLTNFVYEDENADGDTLVFSDMGNGDGNLDVGETWILTGTHTVTQDELDSPGSDYTGALDTDGDVDNKVVVTFTEAGPKDSSVETDLVYAPDFSVLKEVTSITDDDDFGATGQADSAGDVINYLITVTNTGNVTLTNFTYDDQNADGDTITVSTNGNGDANLDVGETWTFTATHTITQDELDSPGSDETGALDTDGDVDNKVVVDFDEAGPKDSSVETDLIYAPDFTVQKAVTSITDDDDFGASDQADSAGDVIHYSITIINTGNITLTNFVYEDENADGDTLVFSDMGNGDGNLDVGETWILTGTHTVTQDELDSPGSDYTGALDTDGDVDNKVVVTFTEAGPKDSSVETDLVYAPDFTVLKEVTSITDDDDFGASGQADSDGDIIHYLITVTNTGNITLTNFVYEDQNADGDTITVSTNGNGDANLDVGETWTFVATHTVTQAELDSPGSDYTGALDTDGDVDNRVVVDFDEAGPKDSSVETDLVYAPDFTVQKAVTSITDDDDFGGEGQADSAGDVIHYSITIINTGNITLTNFVYEDENADGDTLVFSDMGNGDGNLDVGETWILTGTHTVTQDELDSPGSDYTGALDTDGDVDNKVVVEFDEAGPKDDAVFTPLVYTPDFTVTKAVTSITDGDDFGASGQADSAGDVINYLITVTNTGNITLTNFTYDDQNADGDVIFIATNGNGDANLDVGETWTFTATHTVTQDELNSPGSDETGALDTDGDVDNWVTVDFDEVDPKTGKVDTPLIYIASIALEKYVSVDPGDGYIDWAEADNPMGPVTSYLSDALFFVEVVNDGNVTLTGLTFADQVTSPVAFPVDLDYAALGAMVDTDGDGLVDDSFANLDAADGTTDGTLGTLELQPGDAIGIYYSLPFVQGQHTNTAYVSSDQTGTYDDPANYYGLVNDGEGVRTPGFWQNPNNGLTFWDGIDGNEAHSGEGFPDGDLLYDVYVEDTNGDGFVDYADDPSKGLLLGDWNLNGLADDGNNLFIPYDVAVDLVSGGGGADAGVKIGRDVTATWLNWLNGNSLGDPSDPGSPHSYFDAAIDWLQEFVSDADDADIDFANFLDDGKIRSKDPAWKVGVDEDGPSGRAIHNALDSYNNDGTIWSTEYAGDADNEAFIYALENLAIVQPAEEYAKFDDLGLSTDMMPALEADMVVMI